MPDPATSERTDDVDRPTDDTVSRWTNTRPWHFRLALISLGGLGIRIGYAFVYRRHIQLSGDAFFYHYQAKFLVAGKWFINPYTYIFFHRAVPSADHPPLWTLALALAVLVGIKSVFGQIIWSCVIGSIAVWLVGLAGREVTGPRAGLIAAGVAALYPTFWINDGSLMAETLVLAVTALTLWAFYRLWRRPTLPRAAWLGFACILAALTRSELVLLAPIFVIAAGLLTRRQRLRRRFALSAVAALAAAATFAPWWAYNQSRFTASEPLSSQLGVTLATANCNDTYYGKYLGYWSLNCAIPVHIKPHTDPSVQDREYRQAAFRYIEHHKGRLPIVLAARLGRELDVYRPLQQVDLEWSVLGRPRLPAYLGMGAFYLVAAFAIGGAVALRRRRIPVIPLAGCVVVTMLVAMAFFGQTRYRTCLDAAIVILSAVAVDAFVGWRQQRHRPRGKHVRPQPPDRECS